ncbi:MAG: choice-of-anchor Q domain-containing protein, partial [Pirellulales bacterium]
GGGVRSVSGNLTIRRSTLTGNVADSDDNSSGRGGGLFVGSGTVTLDNALVAGNIRRVSIREDIFGSVTARYALVGDNTGATIASNGLNLIGIASAPIDPLLGPLADNGGPTRTHALMPGSPAIDLGDPYAVAGADGVSLYDQRGESFARVINGDGLHDARIDIGAFEVQSVVVPPELLGDYNEDGAVDAADYTVWRDTLGQSGVSPYSGADGSGNGSIGPEDFDVWKSHFGETLPASGGGASEQRAEIGKQGIATASLLAKPVSPDRLHLVLAEFGGRGMVRNLQAWIRPPAELGNGAISRVDHAAVDIGLLAWLAALEHDERDFRGAQHGQSVDHESTSSAAAADEEFALLGDLTVGLVR